MIQADIDRNEIIEMAGKVYGTTDFHKSALFHLEAFAKLVMDKTAEREREACAKLVEVPDNYEDWEIMGGSDGRELLNGMAAKIRARGEQQ